METLKVRAKSNPNSVAGALANVFREKGTVEIQAIGAGALNCIPAFTDIIIDGEERTAIKLIVESR